MGKINKNPVKVKPKVKDVEEAVAALKVAIANYNQAYLRVKTLGVTAIIRQDSLSFGNEMFLERAYTNDVKEYK